MNMSDGALGISLGHQILKIELYGLIRKSAKLFKISIFPRS